MVVVYSLFFASLAGIVALFGLKMWEEKRMRTLVPRFRLTLDRWAIVCRELLSEGEQWLMQLPSKTASFALRMLAIGARGFAHLARTASESSHRLADFVSHKRNFERREVRSDFLKQVIEHQAKNQNGSTVAGRNGLSGNGKEKKKRTKPEVDIES